MRADRRMTKYETKVVEAYANNAGISFEQAAQRMMDAAAGLKIDTKTVCVRTESYLKRKYVTLHGL
jgi:hypothetical protein